MNTYPFFAYGHDFGNSETCAVLLAPGLHQERRIPSVASLGNWQRYVATAQGAGLDNIQVQHNHYILEYDQAEEKNEVHRVEKIIGQKVFDDGATPLQTIGDSSRYWVNGYSLEMLMVGAGSIIAHDEFGVYVVTGLPIGVYLDDPTNKERVKQALRGDHRFWLNGRERLMHVLDVGCIMEGAGALIAYGSTEDVLQGVIDIGGHTTDLYCSKGQKPRQALCQGIALGVATAAERLNDKFREHFGYSPTLETLRELMSQHVHEQPLRPVRDKKHQTIDSSLLHTLVDAALREVGREIATAVIRAWDRAMPEIDQVRVVGGGAHYFINDIQERIKHAQKTHRPEMANAEGYAALADRLARHAAPSR
jgi:hypothetical protein